MSDTETQLRATLRRLAGSSAPVPMPSDVPRRVRRRRVGATCVVATFVVATAVVVASVARLPDRDEGSVPANDPFRSVPASWPHVVLGSPDGALLSGTVDGHPFRLLAETDTDGGPCVRLDLPDARPRGSGIRTCRSDAEAPVPTMADLDIKVIRDDALGHLEANVGFVSDRTASLTVRSTDSSVAIPILPAPQGWNVQPFLFFPPPALDGWLDAQDAQRTVLADTLLCGSTPGVMGCRGAVEQLAEVPGSYAPPPIVLGTQPGDDWDYLRPIARPAPTGDSAVDVRYGGDVTPYVDREDPSPVIGQKIVVTYGTADGLTWGLSSYQTNGRWGSNDVGALALFFGHAASGSDPGQMDGGRVVSAEVPHGEAMSLGVDPRQGQGGSGFLVVFGWVSTEVDHVDIAMQDGWTQQVPVEHAGPVDMGWILAFVPSEAGTATPVTADGSTLQRAAICAPNGQAVPPSCPAWSEG